MDVEHEPPAHHMEVGTRTPVVHAGKHLTHELLELRDVGSVGRGWFALADIGPGTKLWEEKAFTVGRNRADLVRRVRTDLGKHAAFCRPTDAHDEESQAEGIVKCNYFDNGAFTGSMLFELTSMLNHSCCPNASVWMLQSEFGAVYAQVTTVRPVAAGEQICITYSRAKLFHPAKNRPCHVWGFGTPCPRCAQAQLADELDRWALCEAAAAAAAAAKNIPPGKRTVEVAASVLPLLKSAAEVLERCANSPQSQSLRPPRASAQIAMR